MSLLQTLTYQDYKNGCALSYEICEVIAKLANINVPVSSKNPGETLIKYLDRQGYSVQQYKNFLKTAFNTTAITTYYKPQSKVAILIANERYEHLSKLATPLIDCESLALILRKLGFITITIKNTVSSVLQNILERVLRCIPDDSYCFFFYAGHGCEIYNVKCVLSVNCPTENIEFNHIVTENWILKEVAKSKPDTCVLIMDMCRLYLNRDTNKNLCNAMPLEDYYTAHKNLIIGYSTQSSQAAYEVLQIECSETIDSIFTYELETGDTDKIVPGTSQYVKALCTHLLDNSDINRLLDSVNGDVEQAVKKQIPIKVQCGVSKRSLYDPAKGDKEKLMDEIKNVISAFRDVCEVML